MTFLQRVARKIRRQMTSRHPLYLHIGTPKTGTSSFQRSLSENRDAIPYYIYGAPDRASEITDWQQTHASVLAHSFIRPDLETGARFRGGPRKNKPISAFDRLREDGPRDKMFDHATQAIRHQHDRVALISAEEFALMRTPEERERMGRFLRGLKRDVIVVVAKRNTDDLRRSWTRQLERSLKNAFEAFQACPDALRSTGEWFYDFDAVCDFWSDFGDLRVVDYDAAVQSEGNVLPSLYRAIDLCPEGLDLSAREKVVQSA